MTGWQTLTGAPLKRLPKKNEEKMLKSEAVKNALALIQRVPSMFCSTIDFQACPDIRAMQNLRSRFLFPKLTGKFKPASFDTYLPVNTYSGKLLQIQKNKNSALYYYDVTTRESALLSGEMKIIENTAVKASFWQPEWEKYFPGSIYGEEYSLVFFKAKRFKYYNGIDDAYENDVPRP